MKNQKILLLLTGGTICCLLNQRGEKDSRAEEIQTVLQDRFHHSASPYREQAFEVNIPMDILSENMTVAQWNVLLKALRAINWADYAGIMIAHGTDTLAYTAAMLSQILSGLPVPLLLISSQRPLDDPLANGNENFRAAVELIRQGLQPDVYAVYRNSDQKMYLHRGALLQQCTSYSEDFFSREMQELVLQDGRYLLPENRHSASPAQQTAPPLLMKIAPLEPAVLLLQPYTGLDYSRFDLTGIRAVLHGLYHSATACVERKTEQDCYGSCSILSLLDRCRQQQIPLFITPCPESSEEARYGSTGDMLRQGAIPLWGMTGETAYAKLLLSCGLGLTGQRQIDFLRTPLADEILR